MVRALHDASGMPFIEVFVDCALAEAEKRDPKGPVSYTHLTLPTSDLV